MFQNLRPGTTLYVLNKKDATLDIGKVADVTPPQMIYPQSYQDGKFTPPMMCVDIDINANGKIITLQKILADATIDDKNGVIVAEQKDAILNEIEVLAKNSQRIVDGYEYHSEIVNKCHALIEELNPQLKKEAEQAKEINDLKQQVNGLSEGLDDIKTMLTKVLNKKGKEE